MDRIPLSVPDLRGRESEYLASCVKDNWVSTAGPYVQQFEEEIKKLIGRKHAVAVVNGTAALHLALVVAGIERDDHVIVPDWTFAASANAIYHAGGIPYFHDVDPYWGLDIDLVVETLEKANKVKGILLVHPLGQSADAQRLQDYCQTAGIPLIEDAAGVLGARYKNCIAGSAGLMGVFSFNGNKVVTAGGGGVIVTDDDNLAVRLRHLSTQARTGREYLHDAVGWNYRMTNLNAAVGLAQLERLDAMIAARHHIGKCYDQAIEDRDDLMSTPKSPNSEGNGWLYSLLCADETDAKRLVDHLDQAGIDARIFWRSLSTQRPYASAPHYLKGRSESLSGRVVSLPSSSHLTDLELGRVIDALMKFQGKPCHL